MLGAESEDDADRDSPGEDIAQLALTGAAVVTLRGIAVRLIGLAGNLVLARLLTPREFGLIAFGATVVTAATFLSEAGLGAGLIRRREPPARAELAALCGIQLVITAVLALLTVAVATPFGGAGEIAAVMVLPLPLLAFRTPGLIVLERALNYKPLASVEIVESVTWQLWAIGGVLAGFGVWGPATAVAARIIAGTVMMNRVSPIRWIVPSFRLARIRGLVRFGAQFQAITLANLGRDQILNYAVAAIGGLSALGIWSLAYRVLQVPNTLFAALMRVSFPALSRVVAAGEEVGERLERACSSTALATGLAMAPLIAFSAHGVEAVFGTEWRAAGWLIAPACVALQFSGPVSVATAGWLLAAGRGGTVLRVTVVHSIVWLGVALGLLPVVGTIAIGLGLAAGTMVDGVLLARPVMASTNARLLAAVAAPGAAATAAGLGGLATSTVGDGGLFMPVLGAIAAFAAYLALLRAFAPLSLIDARALASRAMEGR